MRARFRFLGNNFSITICIFTILTLDYFYLLFMKLYFTLETRDPENYTQPFLIH